MKAHILIIADGRSPTTQSWIRNIQSYDYRVSLISTFNCTPLPYLENFHILPVAFSRFGSEQGAIKTELPKKDYKSILKRFSALLQKLRYWLGPLTLLKYAKPYKILVDQIQPDFVHALRIPFEGMLGSFTPKKFPFIAATWGNDLTLHAKGSPFMRLFTKRCLHRADGLTSDTHRDIQLAKDWGLNPLSPILVVPGSGGIDLQKIHNAREFNFEEYGISSSGPWVVNPRGMRPGSVHQDVFFRAIPKILEKQPDVCFICPGLKGIGQIEEWVKALKIQNNTFLLPKLPQVQLWALFKKSSIFVSPSSHDGTPNSLLESMACGNFPVVGDIESMHEWIEDGVNGYLVNPQDPDKLAEAILNALTDKALIVRAKQHNHVILHERAELCATLPMIDTYYAHITKTNL